MQELPGWTQKSKVCPPAQKKKKKRSNLIRRLLRLFSVFRNLRHRAAPLIAPPTPKKSGTRPPLTAKQQLHYYPVEFDLTAWKKRAYNGRIEDSTYDFYKKDFSQRSRALRKSRAEAQPAHRPLWPALPAYTATLPLKINTVMVTATTVLDHTITTVPYIANRTDKPVRPPSPPNAPEQMLPLDPAEKKPNPSQPSSIVITPPAWLNVYPSSWLMLPDQPRWRHRVCTPTHRPQALNLVAVPNAQQELISTKQPVFIQSEGRIRPRQYEEGRRYRAYPFRHSWRYFSKPQYRTKGIYSKSRQRHTKSPLNAVLHNKQAVHLAYVRKPHYLLNAAYQLLSTATDTNGERQNSSRFSVPRYKLPHTALFLSRRIAQLTNPSRRGASLFRPQLKRLSRASVLSWPVAHHPLDWTHSVHSPTDGQPALNCAAVPSAQQESISTQQPLLIQRQGRIKPRQYKEGRPPSPAPYHSPSTDSDAASDTDDEWYDEYDEHEQNSLNCSEPQYASPHTALPLPSKGITHIKPHQYKGKGRIEPRQYEEGRRYRAYPLVDIQEPTNAPYHSPSTDSDAASDTDDEWYDEYDEHEQNSLNCPEPQYASSETLQPAAHSIATSTGDSAQTERPIYQWVRKNLARIETIFAKLALRHN